MNVAMLSNLEKIVIAGPCAIESIDQMNKVVESLRQTGVQYLRAQLFKPRTHPDSFQGIGIQGLSIIENLVDEFKLVMEVCSSDHLQVVAPYASILQLGARNMQNFELLKQIGRSYKDFSRQPFVMLKRGFGNTYSEWINSALYLVRFGVPKEKIVLCERGSRCFHNPNGVVLDFAMALKAKRETDYQVIIDPSHGSREASLVLPLATAALSLPLDGLMIEIHPNPRESVSDAGQAIALDEFENWAKINILGSQFQKKNYYAAVTSLSQRDQIQR